MELKSMSEKIQAEIFNDKGYTELEDKDGNAFRYKTMDYVNAFTKSGTLR